MIFTPISDLDSTCINNNTLSRQRSLSSNSSKSDHNHNHKNTQNFLIKNLELQPKLDSLTFAMSLGGQAQENFYQLLSEITKFSINNQNYERLRILKFIEFLLNCLLLNQYWSTGIKNNIITNSGQEKIFPSRFIGSSTLWARRCEFLSKMIEDLQFAGSKFIEPRKRSKFERLLGKFENTTKPPNSKNQNKPPKPNLDSVPLEIKMNIKKCLINGSDIDSLNSLNCYNLTKIHYPNNEELIWKNLVKFNFSEKIIAKHKRNNEISTQLHPYDQDSASI